MTLHEPSLSGEFEGQEEVWLLQTPPPNTNTSNYAYSNGSIDFGCVSNAQGQELVDVLGKPHSRAFGVDVLEQLNLDSYLDIPTTSSLTPLSLNQGDTVGPSLEVDQFVAEASSSSPIPSSTSSSGTTTQLCIEPNAPLQIVQYNYNKAQKSVRKHNQPVKSQVKKRRTCGLSSRSDVLKTENEPKTSIAKDGNGKIAGAMTIFGLSQVVRAPVSSELKIATSITRRVGACLRCHQQRLRCDMPENVYEPCGRCMRLLANFSMRHKTKVRYQPCIRVSILDLCLHRKGPTIYDDLHVWVQGKQEQLKLQDSNNTQVLFLTQGFGEGLENALSLTVSRFEPMPGDRTAYFWTDAASGRLRSMEMPPYFISDMEAARQSIRQFHYHARSAYVEALLADANPIERQTFQAALVYTAFGQSKLISEALDVWVAARFIESHWRVFCGGAMVGLEPTNEPGHPYNGFIPATPIMDTQLDDLIIRDLITPLTQRFLKRLKDKIDEQKRENWMEIYFAMFIMMSNIGWVLKDLASVRSWKGLKPGSRGGTLTQGYMHACKTMLAYFHFACAGSVPLSIVLSEAGSSKRSLNGMTPERMEYLRDIQQEITSQEAKLSKWKDLSMYDDEMYWCYQMLCQDWRGDIPYAGEIDDLSEDDFLSSSST